MNLNECNEWLHYKSDCSCSKENFFDDNQVSVPIVMDLVDSTNLDEYGQKEVPVPIHCKFTNLGKWR